MHLIEIPEKDIKVYMPAELAECNDRQYIEMSALIFYFQTDQLSYDDFRIQALYKLLNMKRVDKNENKIKFFSENTIDESTKLKLSKIYLLSELVDTFFEPTKDGKKTIKQYYIHNPIPKIRGNFRNYFGPENDFENVTVGEYLDTLEAYINFNQTGEMSYLNTMVSIMYRKKDVFNKKRHLYNVNNLSNRTTLFKKLHIGITYGFYLYFASFQKYLATAKIFVQGSEIDLSILFDSKAETSQLPGLGMKGVILAMAESGVYGTQDGVRKTLLWEMLIRMYDITKRSKDEAAADKKLSK